MAEVREKVYIYQQLRTKGVKPLYLANAVKTLEQWGEKIFDVEITLNASAIERQISEKLIAERMSPNTTHAVELRLYPSQEVDVVVKKTLYLEPFPLRAIRPIATPHRLSGNLMFAPTSARKALLDICQTSAKLPSESISMWIDNFNEIVTIDGASVVAVTDEEIIFSHLGEGAEFELAEQAMSKTSHSVRRGAILYDDICLFKELLYIDYRGVVALDSIAGRQLSNIIAERIAKEVKKLENL